MDGRRVVITGMGTLCPIGNTTAEAWENAKAGKNGIGTITRYDTSDMKVKVAGEVRGLDVYSFIDKQEARKQERFTHLARIATMEAIAQSGIKIEDEDPYRCGTMISSGIGGLDLIARMEDRGKARGFDRVSPQFIPATITNSAAGSVAIQEGFKGECSCAVTACASSANAIGDAYRAIRYGYEDVMIAGGAESCVTPLSVGGFTSMKALSTVEDPEEACRPFDLDRSGFIIAEGAGILILEELEHARARGATILGELCGCGFTCDAYHITAPNPDGASAAQSMRNALADAGLSPSQIGYINAHGTSTPLNDKTETKAFHDVFGTGEDAPLVSSTKSMTGHMLGAAGAVEAIFTVCAINDGFVPPNIHYKTPDPDCDLNLVANEGREASFDYALSDNLGFGGHNASLIFGRYRE